MAERSNAHDSKSCYGVTHTRVQIPFSAPEKLVWTYPNELFLFALYFNKHYYKNALFLDPSHLVRRKN